MVVALLMTHCARFFFTLVCFSHIVLVFKTFLVRHQCYLPAWYKRKIKKSINTKLTFYFLIFPDSTKNLLVCIFQILNCVVLLLVYVLKNNFRELLISFK